MPYILLLIGCLGLTISSIGLYIPYIQQLDLDTVIWMSEHRSAVLNGIAISLSYLGGLPSMLLICSLWSLQQYRFKKNINVLLICLGLIGSALMSWFLKFWVDRPRPDAIYQMVETYGASFPSGHSVYAAILSCLLMLIFSKHPQARLINVLACFWFLGMGVARVYLGAHYPTDVLAGWSIAFIWMALLWLQWRRFILSKK